MHTLDYGQRGTGASAPLSTGIRLTWGTRLRPAPLSQNHNPGKEQDDPMVWGRPPTREGRAGSGVGPSRVAPPGRVRGSQDDSGARWQGNIPAGRAGAAAAGPSGRSASAQRRPGGRWGYLGSSGAVA